MAPEAPVVVAAADRRKGTTRTVASGPKQKARKLLF
jgi:hypothetical protein